MMKRTISKNLGRFCLRLINGLLIASAITLAGNFTFKPPAGYTQETVAGFVDLSEIGIQLSIPNGWQGQLSDEYLVLGSYNEPGSILLWLNQARSVEELVQTANAGFYDQGIQLTRSGEFQQVGYNGVGAEFSGSVQGMPAKAFIAGVINPYGQGVSILALTSVAEYNARKPALVQEIANSLNFSEPAYAGSSGSSGGDNYPVHIDIDSGGGCSTGTYGTDIVSTC